MKTSGHNTTQHSTMQHNTTREERIIKNRNTRSEKEQIKINVFRRKEGQQVQYQ